MTDNVLTLVSGKSKKAQKEEAIDTGKEAKEALTYAVEQELTSAIILGRKKDGSLYYATTAIGVNELLGTLERFKFLVLANDFQVDE